MAKFSKEKRDQEGYRSILIQNATRNDFICPHCKRSFPISEAKHSAVTRIDDVVWPPFRDMPHTERVPCYAYRLDAACLKKLERNINSFI